ncbi:MAG: NAD-dependent succinate-semialdehyde dehydrogenase [Chitinophagales bacterium]|nr:NAD-dependent succinate-semialdehyde dehydrogenase [Chitinophagales bacterium]
MRIFQSINPFDQSVIAEHEVFTDEKIGSALENSETAFQFWKQTALPQRSDLFKKLAETLRTNKEKYALNISLEMGKILKESKAEVEKCAVCCEYYAEHGEAFLKDEIIKSDAHKSLVAFDPIGAVFAVMPWNFPFWQVIRFAVPAIMAGNVGLLKHAKNVTQCALHLQEAFLEAGFPENIFQVLIIESSQSEKIIQHDIVQGVTLTGSEGAGASVASIAGKCIKKTVMELGGSDAFIVLDDADILQAAKIATQSRMQNAGQSCIAAKRFIVIEKIKDDFLAAFKSEVEKIKQGDQLDENTTMGPLSSLKSADDLEQQQNKSINKGAEVITGAKRMDANYQPTILTNIKRGMPAYQEELFGPVASVITAKDADDAITIANDHRYGLGATLFTRDLDKAYHLARKIQAGSVFINAMVKSDPRLPFGGVKKSGYGRELSYYGMKEFTNIKTVYINS